MEIESISWGPVVLVGTIVICAITWRLYGMSNSFEHDVQGEDQS